MLLGLPLYLGGDTAPVTQKDVRMRNSNTLIVYYSRTGTTATLAEAIAQATGADVERLTDTVDRSGGLGFARSLYDAIFRRTATLKPIEVDPTGYALVLVGTPDWGISVAAPVRTFLETYKGRLPEVAFFLTDGTKDHDSVFKEMARLAGRQPVATLGVPHEEVLAGRHLGQVAAFVKALPQVTPIVPVTQGAPAEVRF